MAREQGYIATIKMFIPVNPKSLDDTVAKATALHDAKQSNDLSGLAKVGAEIMSVDHRFTSRAKAEATAEHGSAETVEEIAEEATQTDVEDAIEEAAETDEAVTTNGRRRRA
jgi:hypothetical protein